MPHHKNLLSTDPHTKDIDATRNHSRTIEDNTRRITAKLLEKDSKDVMKSACLKYFP